MTAPTRYLCDQCQTYDATSIDADARTWCSRCWNVAAQQSTETGTLAPYVCDIAFVRALWPPPWPLDLGGPFSPLGAVHMSLLRRWAERLGLPQEENTP